MHNPAWASLLNREDVVILDTETTGLNSVAECVEIAIVNTQGTVLMDSLVMPIGEVPLEASAIHGITKEFLAEQAAPKFRDIVPTLQMILRSATVLCIYNADYDQRIIAQSLIANGITKAMQLPAVRCIMRDYAEIRQEPGWYGKYRWHKLCAAADYEGVPSYNAHRALGDCMMTLGIMQSVFNRVR